MAFYQRIRDLREDSDKKQSELAEYLGTTTQYYGLYEKGANEISFERAIMLAKYYNVSLDYIAGLTNKKAALDAPRPSKEEAELLAMLNDLSPKSRKKFAALLKQMINTLK
ncbi:MAG: helix-turn-helix transcriptional regulator [Ruminiclostridium sp.]|nr:helix-turn-helix transcriptional regulator [Ruminiclostridium sp.]